MPEHYVVTEESKTKVTTLKSFGVTNEEISTYLGISSDTLVRHYNTELKDAIIEANHKVAAKLFKKATQDEDMTAIIFWLKTRARWRTEDNINLVDSNKDLEIEMKALRAELDKKNKKEY